MEQGTPHGAYHGAAAGIAQLVEHQLPKLRVAGSSPVSRSIGISSFEFRISNLLKL